ncbi:hypothetical protein [Burkholderia pseudomallei]|uniref:hypothetical protein n=1 Tax=Burkholderia pseudomallei TaxID=28450 RepID=UPI0015C3785E|nr:hypothetical protein [Burkholderia pseudomallei]
MRARAPAANDHDRATARLLGKQAARAVCAPIRLGGSARLRSVDDDGAGAQAIEAVRRRHGIGHHDAVPVNAAQAARLRAVTRTPNCALDRLDAARFAARRIDDVDISVAVALGIDINVAFPLDIDIDATRRETRRDETTASVNPAPSPRNESDAAKSTRSR